MPLLIFCSWAIGLTLGLKGNSAYNQLINKQMKKQQILVGMVVTSTQQSTGFGYVVNAQDAAFIAVFIQKMLKPFLPDIKIEVESLELPMVGEAWNEDEILRHLCNGWADVKYEVKLSDDIIASVNTQEEAQILASRSWISSSIQTKVIKR